MAFSWMWEDFLKGRAETACNTEKTLSAKNMLQIFLNMPDSYLSPDSSQFTPGIIQNSRTLLLQDKWVTFSTETHDTNSCLIIQSRLVLVVNGNKNSNSNNYIVLHFTCEMIFSLNCIIQDHAQGGGGPYKGGVVLLVTQKISMPMTEEEEKENSAIKVTVEVKNCGECVIHHCKDAGENIPNWKSYHIYPAIPKQELIWREEAAVLVGSHHLFINTGKKNAITIITIFVQKMWWWFSTLNFVQAAVVANTNQEVMAPTAAAVGANTVNVALQMHQPHRMSERITDTGAPRGISQCSCYKEFVCS